MRRASQLIQFPSGPRGDLIASATLRRQPVTQPALLASPHLVKLEVRYGPIRARGPNFGDVDMEVADRIGLELALRRRFAFDLRQARDAVALQAAMQRRARQDAELSIEAHRGSRRDTARTVPTLM